MPDPFYGLMPSYEDPSILEARWGQSQLDKMLSGKNPSLPRVTSGDAWQAMMRLLPTMQASGQFDPEELRTWISDYESAQFPEEEKQYSNDALSVSQRIQEEEAKRRSAEFRQLQDMIDALTSGQPFNNPFVR